MPGSVKRVTNADIAYMLGEVRGDIASIRQTTDKLDRALNGNGKPGLIEEHRALKGVVEKHIQDDCDAKNKRKSWLDKIDARVWAVAMLFISALVTWGFAAAKAALIK